jgi:hypothetical protein
MFLKTALIIGFVSIALGLVLVDSEVSADARRLSGPERMSAPAVRYTSFGFSLTRRCDLGGSRIASLIPMYDL